LVREGGGWWKCPVGDHTYRAGSCMRWTPTLMWHDFYERYFCFNCHHSWSFEEMKTLLEKLKPRTKGKTMTINDTPEN
jgi:hypothetical protein